jgi:nicotinamide phosphoribosyltransferase
MKMFAPHAVDAYKLGHADQYPQGTTFIYSNLTPRSNRLFKGSSLFDGKMVVAGVQGAVKEIVDLWDESFFSQPKEKVIKRYARRLNSVLGVGVVTAERMAELHDHGFLPIQIKALPEGSRVSMKTPILTICNTDGKFFWVVNYLETILSNSIWKTCTAATIAYEYKKVLTKAAIESGFDLGGVQFQAHDFAFRGQSGPEDGIRTGIGHLFSFSGTDTFAAVDYLEDYYFADSDREMVGVSVAATEHAVSSTNILSRQLRFEIDKPGVYTEKEALLRAEIGFMLDYITRVVPTGIASYVGDTYDYFALLTDVVPALKGEILARNGKLVIRPDSGDPVKIICGDPEAAEGTPENKGSIQLLWETFGGTLTNTGHKLLDDHIGLIYGDSITIQRAEEIMNRLLKKGFCSGNVVFGVGSYTYQMNTRDTFGQAIKATAAIINGEFVEIYKDPATGDKLKKSAKGLLRVDLVGGEYILTDKVTFEEESGGELKVIMINGEQKNLQTLSDIRERLK